MADVATKIVINMELYEGEDYMKKEHVKGYDPTAATTL